MKTYRGYPGGLVYKMDGNKKKKMAGEFTWGRAGAASLSLSYYLLLDLLDSIELAHKYKMRFMHRVIIPLNENEGWTLSADDLMKHADDMARTEALIDKSRKRVAMEKPTPMSDRGPGIVWDNEPTGGRGG